MTQLIGPLAESADAVGSKSTVEKRPSSNLGGTTQHPYTRHECPSREKLVEITNSCKSIASVINKLGLKGGNARKLYKLWIKTLEIDTSHFTGQQWNKGKTHVELGTRLCENSSSTTCNVKEWIVRHGLLPYNCARCSINSWNEDTLVLELDHINGISNDHRIENLQYLCPNCHSQTSTFRGKNIGSKAKVTDEALLNALRSESNIRQALLNVGLVPKGGNYARCYRLLIRSGQ